MLVYLALSCHLGPSSDITTQLRLLDPSHCLSLQGTYHHVKYFSLGLSCLLCETM